MPDYAPTIMWFRDDLRLADNPALSAAVAAGPVVCVYIHDPAIKRGGAEKWWLHGALEALDADLRARGGQLCLMAGAEQSCMACAGPGRARRGMEPPLRRASPHA